MTAKLRNGLCEQSIGIIGCNKMKTIINKLILLSILTSIGIGMVLIAYAAGVTEQLPPRPIAFIGVVDGNNRTLDLIHDGEIVQTMKLPERVYGIKFFSDDDSGKIFIEYITKEKLDDQRELRKEVLDKAIRIAESDKNVQQLIKGKEYSIPMSGIIENQEGIVANMIIVIENKNYEVIVNLISENVIAVEEVKQFNNSYNISYSNNGNNTIDTFKVKLDHWVVKGDDEYPR
ncbi:MAG: hypothetical protein IBX40_11555 [Methanosarcinales archaeon]|nr:hypothetical protein [Methanosarcinales archaeon]